MPSPSIFVSFSESLCANLALCAGPILYGFDVVLETRPCPLVNTLAAAAIAQVAGVLSFRVKGRGGGDKAQFAAALVYCFAIVATAWLIVYARSRLARAIAARDAAAAQAKKADEDAPDPAEEEEDSTAPKPDDYIPYVPPPTWDADTCSLRALKGFLLLHSGIAHGVLALTHYSLAAASAAVCAPLIMAARPARSLLECVVAAAAVTFTAPCRWAPAVLGVYVGGDIADAWVRWVLGPSHCLLAALVLGGALARAMQAGTDYDCRLEDAVVTQPLMRIF